MFKIKIKNNELEKIYDIPSCFEIIFGDSGNFEQEGLAGKIVNFNNYYDILFNINEDFSNKFNLDVFLYKDENIVYKTYLNHISYLFLKNRDEKEFTEFLKFYK